MIRRYDLTRSDNAPYTKKKAFATNGTIEGFIFINTGFIVSHAIVTWSSIYPNVIPAASSTTSSSSELSTESTSSSSYSSDSSDSTSSSSESVSDSSDSSSSIATESSSSTESSDSSMSSSSSSNEWEGAFPYPRIYVYSYQSNGFTVRYENLPSDSSFVEFEFVAY